MKKPLLITIDTEGDNLWARPRHITSRNAAYLPRFQSLCERYGYKPTYLVNYEMAVNAGFVEFSRDLLRRDGAEIGLHLHAWHSPPDHRLTSDDYACSPYLIEFPREVMAAKIRFLTSLLEDTFETGMVSHRAGRWAINADYARELVANGYMVDCSVTPHVSWMTVRGATRGGSDYRNFPTQPYFVNLDDIERPGNSPLLELPMSIRPRWPTMAAGVMRRAYHTRLGYHLLKPLVGLQWLRPNGANRNEMIELARDLWSGNAPYAQFMLHSSELMPGGSPNFPTGRSIDALYEDIEALFDTMKDRYYGSTLKEFRANHGEAFREPRITVEEPGFLRPYRPRAATVTPSTSEI